MKGDPGRERVMTLAFYGVVVLLAYLLYKIFDPFLAPLAWAGIIVVCFYGWHARLEARFGPGRAAALSTLIVTLVLIVPSVLVMVAFVNEGVNAAGAIEAVRSDPNHPVHRGLQRGWEWLQPRLPADVAENPADAALEYAQKFGSFVAGKLGAILKNVALFLFDLFLMLFATFYLFRDAGVIMRTLRHMIPFPPAQRDMVLAQARELIAASVFASLAVAAAQGFLGGVAFAIVGLRAPVFWGVVMAFFSLIPVVGSWIIWVPAAVYLFVVGETTHAIVLVAIGAGLVSTVDNFLRPILVSGKSQMNGLLIFISMLGGISVFGMLGFVLGPIVVATSFSLLKTYADGNARLTSV